jgi:hypothetical protein
MLTIKLLTQFPHLHRSISHLICGSSFQYPNLVEGSISGATSYRTRHGRYSIATAPSIPRRRRQCLPALSH